MDHVEMPQPSANGVNLQQDTKKEVEDLHPGRDVAIKHTLVAAQFTTGMVGMQFYDMPWSGRSFTTSSVWTQFRDVTRIGMQLFDMPWSGRSYSTCPGCDAILRHVWSECSFTTWPGLNEVLWHALVRTQFNKYPGRNVVLRHALVAMTLFATCLGRDAFLRHAWSGHISTMLWSGRNFKTYPLPQPFIVGWVRSSRLWSTSQLLYPTGQQWRNSGGNCSQIQGRQRGTYVGEAEDMMCVVCMSVTNGT